MAFTLTSLAFDDDAILPARHAPDGRGTPPPLAWRDAPSATRSFMLLCHDPDAARGDRAHWLIYDLPSSLTSLPEGGGVARGTLVRGDTSPCPPARRCQFDLYALSVPTLGLSAEADREAVEAAMEGYLLSRARLTAFRVPTSRSMLSKNDPERNSAMMTDNPDDLDILTDDSDTDDEAMDGLPDGDRQLSTSSDALDGGGPVEEGDALGGGNNDSDLGADVAGDIGPKHN